MSNLKTTLLSIFLALGTIITSSAFAYTPLNSTSTTSLGPETISILGQNVPCHMSITFHIDSSGAMTITAVTFTQESGDSSFCPHITANSLPWTVGPATQIAPGIYTFVISGISITIPGIHITCTGSVTVTIDNNNGTISLNGTLHNGSIACGFSGTGFSTLVRAP